MMKKFLGVLILVVVGILLVACTSTAQSSDPIIVSGVTKSGNAKLNVSDLNSYSIKIKAPTEAKYLVIYYNGNVVDSKKVGSSGYVTWSDHAGTDESAYKVQIFATKSSYAFGTKKSAVKAIGQTSYTVPYHTFGSSSESSTNEDDSTSSSTADSIDYAFGDTVEFESGEKITVTSAKDISNVELNDAVNGQSGVAVTVTVQNMNTSPLDFNAQRFSLYDGNDENANFDSHSYSNNIPDSIAAGMKATFTMYFDITTKGDYTVTYGDAIWRQ